MDEATIVSQEIDERPFRRWEKQENKDFIWRLVLFSGIGGLICGLLLIALGLFLFLNFWLTAPLPEGRPAPISVFLLGSLYVAFVTSIISGLPLGLFQWFAFKGRLNNSRMIWWIFVYFFGYMLSFFGGLMILEYFDQEILPIIIIWALATISIGSIQGLILKKYISRRYLFVLLNILGIPILIIGLSGGIVLYQFISWFGFILAGSLGGAIYGGILGLGITSTLRKDVVLKM